MAKLYFVKMNINNKIYEVYNNKHLLPKLLQSIFLGISTEEEINDEKGGRYKFFDIDKRDDMTLTGYLGYIKSGVHSSYDPDTDDAIDITDKNKLEYITFYFDVQHEILAYMTVPVLGKKRVPLVFSKLILEGTKKYEERGIFVEFMPISNSESLDKAFKQFKQLSKIEVNLVLPNGDKKDWEGLTSIFEDANVTKSQNILSSSRKEGIDLKSKMIDKVKNGSILGFLVAKLTGKNSNNEKIETNTAEDSPYTKNIPAESTKSQSVIREKGSTGVNSILINRPKIKPEKE